MSTEPFEVSIEWDASDEARAEIVEMFADAGFDCEVRADFMRKAEGELPWLVLILVPSAAFLKAFGQTLGERAAEDVYDGMRRFLRAVMALRLRREGRAGFVRLDDAQGNSLIISEDLPPEAWDTIDRAIEMTGHVSWSDEDGEWRSY